MRRRYTNIQFLGDYVMWNAFFAFTNLPTDISFVMIYNL